MFNNGEFNFHTTVRKSGEDTTNPHIVPFFLIKKKSKIISEDNLEVAEKYSDFVWSIKEEAIMSQSREHLLLLYRQFEILERDFFKKNFLILPIGIIFQCKIFS